MMTPSPPSDLWLPPTHFFTLYICNLRLFTQAMSPVPFSPITVAPAGAGGGGVAASSLGGGSAASGFYSGSVVAPPGSAGHSIFDYQA